MTGTNEAQQKLAALKAGYVSQPRPSITVAFDLAESALVKAMDTTESLTARYLTKRMLKAVMEGGFMIMHRDEMQDAILMAAQIKSIIAPQSTETES